MPTAAEQRGDCGGGGGGGGGKRGYVAHLRDPIDENEEVVVAATRKPRRASAHVMHAHVHACTPLEAPHAKPASLRGELRNRKCGYRPLSILRLFSRHPGFPQPSSFAQQQPAMREHRRRVK